MIYPRHSSARHGGRDWRSHRPLGFRWIGMHFDGDDIRYQIAPRKTHRLKKKFLTGKHVYLIGVVHQSDADGWGGFFLLRAPPSIFLLPVSSVREGVKANSVESRLAKLSFRLQNQEYVLPKWKVVGVQVGCPAGT